MTIQELEALVRVHAARIQRQDDSIAGLQASNLLLRKKLDLLDTRTKAPPLRRALDPVVSTARH
jgi:hypothetical protein